jgi:glutamyl-tRNA reductase
VSTGATSEQLTSDSFVAMLHDQLESLRSFHSAQPLALPREMDPSLDPSIVLLGQIRDSGVRSAVVLNTCQRAEVYVETEDLSAVETVLATWINNSVAGFQPLNGILTIDHLMRVACGLESSVLGEAEILGQVRRAHQRSVEVGMCKGLLDRAMQRAVSAGKRSRCETKIGQGTASLTSTIQSVINRRIKTDTVLTIIGAGMIGSKLVRSKHLTAKVKTVNIVNRTFERAQILAHEHGANAVQWSNLASTLQGSDIIVVAISGGGMTINVTTEIKSDAYVVDVSVPAVAYASNRFDTTRILDLPHLEKLMRGASELRRGEIPKVMRIIEEELSEVISWADRRSTIALVGWN